MIALVYLALMTVAGDVVARRFFGFTTVAHRLATAFLVGLLGATWLTYLGALAFASSEQPLVPANLLTLVVLAILAAPTLVPPIRRAWARRVVERDAATAATPEPETPRRGATTTWLARLGPPARPVDRRLNRYDWALLTGITLFVGWMMLTTFGYRDGMVYIGAHEWGDFGPATAIAQSFALGHNVPTTFPMLAGEPILYHFLFQLQAGNLTFLGLDLALANNLLSIGSMVAMLIVITALGERLFGSAAVGRGAAILFFFHGSLSFAWWIASFPSPFDALASIWPLENFLASPFDYHAEDWAIWTQNVFLNQRHLASGIGLVLVVLVFVIDQLRVRAALPAAAATENRRGRLGGLRDPNLPGYVASGVILGLLPLWNGPMFVASAAILAGFLVLTRIRVQLLVLAAVSGILALPQILYLRPEGLTTGGYPTIQWGFVVDPATAENVVAYLAFLFGVKLVLAGVALAKANRLQWTLFLAAATLVAVAFLVRFSIDIAQNHKFLTFWLILVNVYVAAGLGRLWHAGRSMRLDPLKRGLGRAVAVGTAAVILVGGAIDLVPIKNDPPLAVPMAGDRLFEWVRTETDPDDVFLTDIHIVHPILLAGRSIYFGWPVYPLSYGYDLGPRERAYKEMLTTRSPRELVRQLQEEGIRFVAFDDTMRERGYAGDLNEDLYREHMEVAFDDPEDRYDNLAIYAVPDDPAAAQALPGAPAVDPFTGGPGRDPGRFAGPRGLGIGADGTIAVADTQNHRVQLFEPDGGFRAELGQTGVAGSGEGQLNEPGGVAIAADGTVWVADSLNHRLVGFAPDGSVRDTWAGPEPGFYGPRDVATGPDDAVYVLDQGRARVVRRAADGEVTTFGSFGSGEGQLNDPTGLAVGADGRVYVADTANGRIVVFEPDGTVAASWPVDDWAEPFQFPDLVATPDGETIYASSPTTGTILEFGPDGEARDSLGPADGDLRRPGGLGLTGAGELLALDEAGNRIVRIASGN